MKLVFCGTPEFAVPSLQAIVDDGHEVELVLTQPDRPAGRKMELAVPPVKRLAASLGIAVQQPETIKNNFELRASLEAIGPDAIVVVAYGRIIPQWMLDLPRFGNINVHGSLLPKYRGAAPIQWAVANGEERTGVTTMKLNAGMDTGDTIISRSISIGPHTMSAELFPQLSQIGAAALLDTLRGLQEGSLVLRPQDHSQATAAPILTRDDGRLLSAQRTAQEAYDRWRGFSPWPGCWDIFRGRRFLVHRLLPFHDAVVHLKPGELGIQGESLLLGAAGESTLALQEVQIEGKARMQGIQFARDFQLKHGDRLG